MCVSCNQRFTNSNGLKKHIHRIHMPYPLELWCIYCGKMSRNCNEVGNHIDDWRAWHVICRTNVRKQLSKECVKEAKMHTTYETNNFKGSLKTHRLQFFTKHLQGTSSSQICRQEASDKVCKYAHQILSKYTL